ncbi:hypothetical protein [uncultured Ruthenibacterium sp.]|uniref:hypothetical protein n=1 Tax=uncultured Ruthenibacterium sp. TaxID=1905347 RepID=UPI00349E7A0C
MNTSQTKKNEKINLILRIVALVILIWGISSIINYFSNAKPIRSAENYVNQQVYQLSGQTCKTFDSEVIYKSGSERLISVKFYLEDTSKPSGSFCVYCIYKSAYDSTTMMDADFSYEEHLDELKALFGVGI